MIDYTRRTPKPDPEPEPGPGPDPDADLVSLLRRTGPAAEAVLALGPLPAGAEPSEERLRVLEEWYEAAGSVGAACGAACAREDRPTLAVSDALEAWLRRAGECLAVFRALALRPDGDARDRESDRALHLELLARLNHVHEEADRQRRYLASRRDGITPERADARFAAGRAAHRALAAEALAALPPGDLRRDEWLLWHAFTTLRVSEYGPPLVPAAIDEALALAEALTEAGRVLDDDQRRHARSVAAALATRQKTGGDPARATDLPALVLHHRAVWQASDADPLTAARYGTELFRAVQLGVPVPGLTLHDAVHALDRAVRDLDPESPDFPETAAAHALAHSQAITVEVSARREADRAIRRLDAARAILPPGHEFMLPLLLALAQLLSRRADHSGSLADVRSALALLRRIRRQDLTDPLHRLYVDAALACVHARFHFHTAADDADCTALGDDGAHPDDRTGHSARVHQQLRLHLGTARSLADRTDHAPEPLNLVLEVLGQSLLLAATYPDGPGAGPHRGADRLPLVTEARTALREAVERTDPSSPHLAGRELHHLLASLVEARQRGDAAADRAHTEALGRLAERPDVAARPELRQILRGVHAYATTPKHLATPARADVLRALEARCAERPDEVHVAALQLRLHLARAYRTPEASPVSLPGPLGLLLGRLAAPSGPTARPTAADATRARQIGRSVLRLLAARTLVQDSPGDAVLTAERAGSIAREVAGWCVEDGALEEAVDILESGRALALHTEIASVDVAERLTGLGRADLAARWQRWRASWLDRTREGEDAPDPGPWDSYTDHPVPEQLGVEVRAALEEHGALDALSATVPVPDIAAALRATGADELVYLLPGDSGPRSGGALRVGSDGRVRWTPMPGQADTWPLESYLGALEARLASPGSETVRRSWRTALAALCAWAGTTVVAPLLADGPGGRRREPARPPHLVLVPLGSLAAVPWAAATVPGPHVGGRPRLAVDELLLSTAPSARMFTLAAARPAARAGNRALLVLGLTGKEARVSSSRALYSLYGHRVRLLTPAGSEDGDTRPDTVLGEIRRACGEHGIVDVAAHLMPDPSESWRSYLAFGRPDGERAEGPAPHANRLSAQAIAAQRFPVPSSGPGLCVSLASCVNHVVRRHHDESFTMAAAFLTGGASSVLGSLWPVRLHATALVDLLFHHRMREGDAPIPALRAAQLWMADPARNVERAFPESVRRTVGELLRAVEETGHDPADPALWAGLVMVGR
ncbi:CHAT domain-containing protein [Streptomyces sp. NPDC048606]|uniref:CHAT domain-containing protein n=1 Tax=Streptomyces sp. NPDC048606 TaxID=3154726 RepID=UPI0034129140